MATAAPEKKPNPNALKPKQNLLVIGAVMIALATVWFLYSANPYGMLRAETEDEVKERKDFEAAEKQRALDAKRGH